MSSNHIWCENVCLFRNISSDSKSATKASFSHVKLLFKKIMRWAYISVCSPHSPTGHYRHDYSGSAVTLTGSQS